MTIPPVSIGRIELRRTAVIIMIAVVVAVGVYALVKF